MTTTNFSELSSNGWKEAHRQIFGPVIPERAEWTDTNDIIRVLNIIGSYSNSNHTFFPARGGLDLIGARKSYEPGSIELNFQTTYVIKPAKLKFESFSQDLEWNYFRIVNGNLEPSGVINLREDDIDEELTEVSPLTYMDRCHWDDQEFEGEKLPPGSRLVTRLLKGDFVIFKKSSIYNKDKSTYDGRHSAMGDEGFRKYIV